MTINRLEEKVLKALLTDSRTPFSKIAQQNGVTSNTIRTAYKKMQESGIITGSTSQIDPRYFGYNCIAFLLIQTAIKNEKQVIRFLAETHEVISIMPSFGKYNITFFVCLKNIDQLTFTIANVRKNPHVITLESLVLINAIKIDRPENLIMRLSDENHRREDNKEPKEGHVLNNAECHMESNSMSSIEMDETDIQIVKELVNNSRISFRRLAKKIGISTQSVIRRYSKLKDTVIPHSSITIDLTKLGYVGTAVFLVNTSQQMDCDEILKQILKIQNIIVATRLFGKSDIFLAAPILNIEQLFQLKKEIGSVPTVQQIELLIGKPMFRWPVNLFENVVEHRK